MTIEICKEFDVIKDDPTSQVFEIQPNRFKDDRGYFQETFKVNSLKEIPWLADFTWVKQINRSSSIPNVFRGMHAQFGPCCQSKLVECVKGHILDVIIDARPESKTFRKIQMFDLDGEKGNMVFVPQGFLHGFASCQRDSHGDMIEGQNIFQYYVGGSVYDKKSEFSVSAEETLKELKQNLEIKKTIDSFVDGVQLSEKDLSNAVHLNDFLDTVYQDFLTLGKIWHK